MKNLHPNFNKLLLKTNLSFLYTIIINNMSTEHSDEFATFQDQLKAKSDELNKNKTQYAKSNEALSNTISKCNQYYASTLSDLQSTFNINEEYMAMIVKFQSHKINTLIENQTNTITNKAEFDNVIELNVAEIKRLTDENTKLTHQVSSTTETTAKLQTRNNAIQPELNKLQRKHNESLDLHKTKDQQIRNYIIAQTEATNTIQQLHNRTTALAQSSSNIRFNYAWNELMTSEMRKNFNNYFKLDIPEPKIEVVREDNIALAPIDESE